MAAWWSISLCIPTPHLPAGEYKFALASPSSLSRVPCCQFKENNVGGSSPFRGSSRVFQLSWTFPRRTQIVLARKKSSPLSTQTSEDVDPDIAVGLTETSTEALKVMLGENIQEILRFRDKVDAYGEYLVRENHLEAAKFMLVIRGMLEHQVLPEAEDLQGPYKKAFDKMWGVVEDSGWLLTQPGAEGGEVEMVDDELMPPVLTYKH